MPSPSRALGGGCPRPPICTTPARRARPRHRRAPSDPFRGMRLALAGVSHHRAPLEVRERVAVDLEAAGELARSLAASGGPAHEAVVLSTCNRTELYVAGDDGIVEHADRALSRARRARRARDRARCLSPRRRVCCAPSVPGRGRARLDGARRGRDPRPGEGGIRGRIAGAAARPHLPHGASGRPPCAGRDRDRREPRVDPRRSGGARASRCSSGWRDEASCSSVPGG